MEGFVHPDFAPVTEKVQAIMAKKSARGGMAVAVYPGSFDPLTIAHLVIAETAVDHLGLERIDLATGARAIERTLASQSLGSPVQVLVADWVDDGRWYAYNYSTVPSILFAVTGASPD